MISLIKTLLTHLLCLLFISSQALAAGSNYSRKGYSRGSSTYSMGGAGDLSGVTGSEYISGAQPGTVLMKVNLWGAVLKPGIHHVPASTDLMTLMSYAGGPSPKALLDEVVIKRDTGKSRKLLKVDVDELINGVSHHQVKLQPDDIIVIPASKPLIGQDTVTIITLSSVLVSTVLALVLIEQRK